MAVPDFQAQHDAIRRTVPLDGKTLEQLTLKLGEEYGELVQKVLIHCQADGTQYRDPVSREGLLEEIADVHICLYAVAYRMGFTDVEIDEWVRNKIQKWRKVTGNSPW